MSMSSVCSVLNRVSAPELTAPEQEFGKPVARAPKEWVSFLQPEVQQRFLYLIGKATDKMSDAANITAITE